MAATATSVRDAIAGFVNFMTRGDNTAVRVRSRCEKNLEELIVGVLDTGDTCNQSNELILFCFPAAPWLSWRTDRCIMKK